jgi:hypothetical protein
VRRATRWQRAARNIFTGVGPVARRRAGFAPIRHPESRGKPFEASDTSLIARYAVASVLAEGAETKLQADPADTKALAVWEKAVRTMSALALRLRLGPQSRREKAKVDRPLTWDEQFRLTGRV